MGDSEREEGEERRRDERQPIELKVEYKRLNAFFADFTKNISKGGTFIQTSKPLGIGTEFVFKLYVPHLEEALRIRGRVKWIVAPGEEGENRAGGGEPGMGIRFIYRDDEERREVERVVEKLMVDSLGRLHASRLMAHQGRSQAGDED